ncbi:hypothetical protein [Burkholderia oklahomensis]|uniref:hypothetical protein n=1 Tax=Burkholderia oklahomensis TaxID=342113 RepID=UPI00016A941A|nr:hypothetical protein [Burkholderia oklahomensis]AJX30240.1 putative lipoprotein [Burkholderia oklahomensis C6786]AOI44804.1 hypothetical protein WI23_02705 [Burkholderia oklahomensis C6786]KUY65270.1 hypothetical protein WI23_04275 [Burkholderia oklahomensis C6786]MBI0359178.1 hypothetical protein [Burkholderia oklahomensis]SUW58003.1 Uncharacterised protein [Burkholderia oklahomensis]
MKSTSLLTRLRPSAAIIFYGAALLAGCSTVNSSGSAPVGSSGATEKFQAIAFWPHTDGLYVLLEQQPAGNWKVEDLNGSPLYAQNDRQEVLRVHRLAGPSSPLQISLAHPAVENIAEQRSFGGFDHTGNGMCNPIWRGNVRVTNGCASRLVRPRGADVADAVADTVTLGAAARPGAGGTIRYEIDPDAIRDLVAHSDLFDAMRRGQDFQNARREREYEARWLACVQRNTTECYDTFVQLYGGYLSSGMYDPKGYTARARDIALTRMNANKALIEQRAAALRRSLRPGSETNFGRVLEVRGTSVEVAVALPGIGNAQWVPIEYIYPPGYASAEFFGGQPQRPVLDKRLVYGE